MNSELIEALNALEKEKRINKEVMITAIEESLLNACKTHFGKNENFTATVDRNTGDFHVVATKTVVETVEDDVTEISLAKARMISDKYEIGDTVNVDVKSVELGRIAIGNAKNIITQKIREEERNVLFEEYYKKERDIMTGVVQRQAGKNVIINLGRADGILNENEMVKGEKYRPNDRIKVFVLEVKADKKVPRIIVSRSHTELVKRLFEAEVTEIKDGTVEIKSISREPGSRTKMAVWSKNPDVDPVGACVGVNGSRVNTIVDELNGEKIDVICWNENPANFIENALSPAKVVAVWADDEEKTAQVIVPDYQLSLAIGREGQNARLAARLTGFKIDIKSETQAKEMGLIEFDMYSEEEYDEYDEEYAEEYEEYSDEN